LSNARAVINLSSAENFSFFLAEASEIGVPIIATREASAFCAQYSNVNSLEIDGIAGVVADTLCNSGKQIHRKCIHSTWQEIAVQFEDLYQKVLTK